MVKEFYITIQGWWGEEGQWNSQTKREAEKHMVGGEFSWKGSEGWVGVLPN